MDRGRSRDVRREPDAYEPHRARGVAPAPGRDDGFAEDLEFRERDYEPYGDQGYGMPTYHGFNAAPRPHDEWSFRAFTPVQELPEGISGREQFLRRVEPSAGGFDPPFYAEDERAAGTPDEGRGPAYGRGPAEGRGGGRLDARLFDEIRGGLLACPELDVRDVNLRVERAEAVLTGSVRTPHEKRIAGEIAACVLGVRAVHNGLRVPLRRG